MKDDRHFAELDGMRGVLAVLVMLYHFGLNTVLEKISAGLLHDGGWNMSVDFFFILSGFVLAKSFVSGPPTLLAYFCKRFARLWPVLFLTTVFTMFVAQDRVGDVVDILANFLMLHSLFGLLAINGPSWSIPFEFVLPAIGALWFRNNRSLNHGTLLTALFVFLAASILATFLLVSKFDMPWLRAVAGLGSGFSLYYYAKDKIFLVKNRLLSLFFFLLCIFIMMCSGNFSAVSLLFVPSTCLAIYFGAGVNGLFSKPIFQSLGRWSYSIYLIHFPMMMFFIDAFGYAAMKGNIPLKAALVFSTIVLSALSYELVEKNGIKIGRWWMQNRNLISR